MSGITYLDQLGGAIVGSAAGDAAGHTVALSSDGRTLAVGSPDNDGSGEQAGHVRIFQLNGADEWVQLGADIEGEAEYDYSGWSLALSSDGRTVAIGADANDGSGVDAGHVRIYQLSGDVWVQLGADIDGEAAEDYSGASVALSSDGRTVAIGAPGNDGNDAHHSHTDSSGNTHDPSGS